MIGGAKGLGAGFCCCPGGIGVVVGEERVAGWGQPWLQELRGLWGPELSEAAGSRPGWGGGHSEEVSARRSEFSSVRATEKWRQNAAAGLNARPTVWIFYSGTEILDMNDLKVLDKECPEYYMF